MKKLFTLLFCTGLVSAAFAQSDRERAADVILRGGGATTASYPAGNSCQTQIDAINRNYDAQVAAVRNNSAYSTADQDYKIRQINVARRSKINEVRRSCGTHTTGSENRKYKNKAKSNNGNHYGWEKGKGNPHGNGGKAKGKNKNG
ncbi:MAG: hypothetical protein EOO15_13875 [Chitinophagaceae bacterium]|nr:MAG: hypothetical protein EOO15_13875 [Chitinophagaceae bacterium]